MALSSETMVLRTPVSPIYEIRHISWRDDTQSTHRDISVDEHDASGRVGWIADNERTGALAHVQPRVNLAYICISHLAEVEIALRRRDQMCYSPCSFPRLVP